MPRRLTARRVAGALLVAALAAGWLWAAVALWDTEVPGNLDLPDLDPADVVPARELDEAEDFESFARINALLAQVVLIGVLALYARSGARLARESAAGRIGTGALLGMLGFALVWIAQLPFAVAQLWWERKHDVSYADYWEYVIDSWLLLGGQFLFITIGLAIVMGLAGWLRHRWWVLGAPVFIALALLQTWAYPALIPDLDSPRDDRLRVEARQLARAQDVPDIPVRVEQVEEFTSTPNAEAAGLGDTRRVILWDTLVDEFPEREVRMVLAHEIAHHSRDHLWKALGWYALIAFPLAFLLEAFTRRRGGMYRAEAIPLALLVLVLLQTAALPLESAVSRRVEAEADWVALESGRDPRAAAALYRRFSTKALADPDPPAWSRLLFETHPALVDRVAMARAWEARQRGRR